MPTELRVNFYMSLWWQYWSVTFNKCAALRPTTSIVMYWCVDFARIRLMCYRVSLLFYSSCAMSLT